MNEINKLDGIGKSGYSLNVSSTFDEILKYFKKTFLLNGLVGFILYAAFLILMVLLLGGLGVNFMDLQDNETMLNFFSSTNFIIYSALAGFFIQILIYPIYAGFIQLNRDIDTQEEVGIGNIFKIFKSKKYIHVLGFCIITFLLTNIPAVLFSVFKISFVGTIITYLVTFLSILGLPLILFSNLNSLQALKYSAQLVVKNPGSILAISLLSFLIAMLGIFGCFIGLFFTIPVFFSTQFVLYKKIVGFDDDEFVFDIEKKDIFKL